MNNYDTLGMIKQRLEILYQMVDQLETGGGGGGGGTTDYNELSNKPSIAGQQLVGNKTLSELGAATPSDITDAFSPSTITLVEGGTFPSASRSLLIDHKPINVNDDQYYFLEESGVDYLYGSMPTSGAYPSLSYLRIMKSSFTVEFHNTGIDTVPTDGSDNLITSNAVYDAIQGAGGGGSFFPEVITYERQSFQNYIPADKFSIIQDHAPYSVYDDGWPTNFYFAETSYSYVYISFGTVYSPIENGSVKFNLIEINKTSRKVDTVSPGAGRGFTTINDVNLINQFYNGYFNSNGGVPEFPSDLSGSGVAFGLYKKSSTGSVTNCPTTEMALMEYNSFAGANQRIQKIYTVSGTPTVYIRIFDSNAWSSWYKFEGTIVT